jgi:hypothetical protein
MLSSPAMPILTIETRWFEDGPLPTSIAEWFSDLGSIPPSDWETREDMYLGIPGSKEIGIKARGETDSFDVKCRMAHLGTASFGPAAVGTVESWAKWSHAAAEEWVQTVVRRFPGSRRVWKSRLKRLYRIAGAGDVEEVRAGSPIERGAILEIAGLRYAGIEYWSLAMEAFPTDDRLAADVRGALAGLLEGVPHELTAGQSMAYPEWLEASFGHGPPSTSH